MKSDQKTLYTSTNLLFIIQFYIYNIGSMYFFNHTLFSVYSEKKSLLDLCSIHGTHRCRVKSTQIFDPKHSKTSFVELWIS